MWVYFSNANGLTSVSVILHIDIKVNDNIAISKDWWKALDKIHLLISIINDKYNKIVKLCKTGKRL